MSNELSSASNEFADAGTSEHYETADSSNSAEDQRVARLSRLIEGEIIPRLLICNMVTSRKLSVASRGSRPSAEEVAELARLLLEPDRGPADAYLQSICLRGASRGLICAELLAPTAKHLGELWERDECDFAAVTDGLRRLESVLNDFRDF